MGSLVLVPAWGAWATAGSLQVVVSFQQRIFGSCANRSKIVRLRTGTEMGP